LDRIISYGIGTVLFLIAAIYLWIAWSWSIYLAAAMFASGGALSFVPQNKRTLLIVRDLLIITASLIVNNVLLGLIIAASSIFKLLILDSKSQ
jgi:hypothetical protein